MKPKFDITKIPNKVLWLKMCGIRNIPVGAGFYNEVLEEYPEHFPVEVERKRKWEAIPQSVHDAYWKEYRMFHEALWKDVPLDGGLMSAINNTPEYQAYQKDFERLRPLEEAKEKELHKKYYSQYGV